MREPRALPFVLAMAWRETRASLPRLGLLTAAVSSGVAALVAINSFTHNVQDSVRRQARGLLGADLALASPRPFSAGAESILAEVARASGAAEALPARVTSFGAMAYVPRAPGARLVQVAAIDGGYPFYGRIETSPSGEWVAMQTRAEPSALVDPSLLAVLDARVGDTLALGEGRFAIRATVLNVPGDVGIRTALGPRVFIGARHLARTGLLGFGSRARYEAFFKLPAGVSPEKLADRYRKGLAAERVTLRTVSEDQRNLNRVLGRLGRYLGLVALVALLLGGLGVASAVHVFIQRKTETVAILRCLGAGSRRVLAIYLVQAAAMGLAGSLAGAALGVAVQALLPAVLSDFVPVDVAFAPSWRAIGAGLGTGLWVAMLFALLPLLAVREVSPLVVLRRDYEAPPRVRRDVVRWLARLALAASVAALAVVQAGSLGVGLVFAGAIGLVLGTLWVAALGLIRGLRRFFPSRAPYVWRQGLANLFRPANQTVTVVLALGFGTFLLTTLFLVQHNLLRGLGLEGGADRPNLALFDIQPDQLASLEALVREEGLPWRAPVPIVPMRILSLKGRPAAELLAAAAAPGREEGPPNRWTLRREYRSTYRDGLAASERMVAGKAWESGEWRKAGGPGGAGPVPISVEAEVARELGVSVGDEVVWDVQGVPLSTRVASLREVDWARFEPNFFVVFPEGPLDRAPQTFVTLSRIEDPGRRGRFQRRILDSFPNVSALDLSQVQQAVEQIVGRAVLAIRFMAVFSLATGAVILIGAVATTRYQRLREGALLKTLGARRGQVLRILLSEYLCLGGLAAAAALLLATGAGWALLRFRFESSFVLPFTSLAGLAVAVVALTIVVGLWSSAEVFRRTALEILRAE